MYNFIARAGQCYQLLQDELSKKIFQARIACDLEMSPENVAHIVGLGEQQKWLDASAETIRNIAGTAERDASKLVLYGTNITGQLIASLFMKERAGFYGFCGRRYKEFPNGIMGKPVISPDDLFQNPDEFDVVITAMDKWNELIDVLRKNNFPQAHILHIFKPLSLLSNQYFEFPGLFHRGTAFIDAGCANCRTSFDFIRWCEGDYSKIFAFEPDPISYHVCEEELQKRKIRDFHLIQAGLSSRKGEASFRAGLSGNSHIVRDENILYGSSRSIRDENTSEEGQNVVVPITTIDDTVGEEKIGFIKMDIEGLELDALHGAENVIVRDAPLLAVCVYHLKGDMLAIMDYLHGLVPGYRFWLRHYSTKDTETVLYASADVLSGS